MPGHVNVIAEVKQNLFGGLIGLIYDIGSVVNFSRIKGLGLLSREKTRAIHIREDMAHMGLAATGWPQ